MSKQVVLLMKTHCKKCNVIRSGNVYFGIRNTCGMPHRQDIVFKVLQNIPESIRTKSDNKNAMFVSNLMKIIHFQLNPCKRYQNYCQSPAKHSATRAARDLSFQQPGLCLPSAWLLLCLFCRPSPGASQQPGRECTASPKRLTLFWD